MSDEAVEVRSEPSQTLRIEPGFATFLTAKFTFAVALPCFTGSYKIGSDYGAVCGPSFGGAFSTKKGLYLNI